MFLDFFARVYVCMHTCVLSSFCMSFVWIGDG